MTCRKCERRGPGFIQVYEIDDNDGRHVFDVVRARQIVEDGRPVMLIEPPELLDEMLAVNVSEEFIPEHIDHVDIGDPGIIAHREKNDGGFYFIDGTHRAARCKRDGLPFYVRVLEPRETLLCRLGAVVRI